MIMSLRLIKYSLALLRILIIIMNNIYCIPTYVIWMVVLTPVKYLKPKIYYQIEGLFFHWLLAVVALWSYTAGYRIVESGDDISKCRNKRTLVVVNHQSTADVPLLMANFNTKPGVLPNILWIMDKLFKYTNFGIVSMIHEDFFIASGKKNREKSIIALTEHLKSSYMKNDRKWIVLFPEGGFLRKRKEISKTFAAKNNLPQLDYVTIPRVGAFQAIIQSLCSIESDVDKTGNNYSIGPLKNEAKLEYILDITIAYPKNVPLDLLNIIHGLRSPCTTHMFYRVYNTSVVPKEEDALNQWLYDRFIEKNSLLDNFFKLGRFTTTSNIPVAEKLIQQNVLRTVLVNIFFLISTYLHVKVLCKLYTQCAYYVQYVIS